MQQKRAEEQHDLRQYYKKIQNEIEELDEFQKQSPQVKNRVRSYIVTLFKGNQYHRQIPKQIKGNLARKLRLLAIDRSLSQSMYQFSALEKNLMNDHANKINQERDRQNNFGDALRDLVRLARLNNLPSLRQTHNS